ncbi:translocation/assembly module TamB domain-containing protein [Maribellus mangrovi]|uniref:translocation/assembly module TamB domain-containing protein n=1 Tax=Maribellus mangrovi TaxID=3133146 RepID=UPI0030EDF3CB
MRKVAKYSFIFLTGLLLIILVLSLLTQTAFFREKVKERLILEAERHLNLNLEIEELNGSFYRDIELEQIRLIDGEHEVANFASIRLKYKLLPLTAGELHIDSLVINAPEIKLWQEKDSSWNIGSYFTATGNEKTKKQKPFPLRINLRAVAIKGGGVFVTAFSETIPERVDNLNLLLKAGISSGKLRINLKELNFTTLNPSLVVNEISGLYAMNDQGIQIDSFRVRTEQSALNTDGTYKALENMNADVDASRIDKDELTIFIPGLKLLCSPSLQTRFETENDKLVASIQLQHEEEVINADIELGPMSQLVSNKGPIPYTVQLLFKDFSVEHWLEVENIETLLEGSVDLDGKNMLDPQSFTHVKANLSNSEYNSVKFKTLTMDGTWQSDNINGKLALTSDFGNLSTEGEVKEVTSNQIYSLDIFADQFNVSAFFPVMEQTVVNGLIKADGRGFNFKDMSALADLHLTKSSIYNLSVDSLTSSLSWQKSNIQVDTLEIFAPGIDAGAKGEFNIDSLTLDVNAVADIDSLWLIKHWVELPLSFDSVSAFARVHGPVNQLNIQGKADVFDALGYNASLRTTYASYEVNIHPDSLKVSVEAVSGGVEYAQIPLDSVTVDMEYMNNKLDLTAGISVQDTLDLAITTSFLLGDTMVFSVSNLEANTMLSNYFLKDSTKATLYGMDKIELDSFLLLDRNAPEFLLSANGKISTADTNSIHLELSDLNLGQFNRFISSKDTFRGILDADLDLKGTARDPILSTTFEVQDPGYGVYDFTSIKGEINYLNQQGEIHLEIPELGEGFYANASSYFDAYMDSLKFIYSEPDSFNAELNFGDIRIGEHFSEFIPNDSLRGVINANLRASGDFNSPQIYGNINLDKVKYQNKQLGLDFTDLKTSVLFDGNKVSIDTIFIQQKNGLISVSGDLEFDSTIVKGNIISSTLEADANNFLIARNKSFEVLIDANTFLKTGRDHPEFGGHITVLRSDVYLPALFKGGFQDTEDDVPMLVEALQSSEDTMIVLDSLQIKKKNDLADLFNNITGRLRVEIPRNTWLRSADMRLELNGDVDVVKRGPYFELFGEIEIMRGHYILYGKKLNIKKSQIIFNGGEEFDPTLNFTAQYVFRGQDREKRYLDLLVTGTLEEPNISFRLDDTEVTENDGVSVLLFGTTADNIGFGEQNGLIASVGSNAVASLITSQLSRTIGTQLNLDMIEVTATESWQSAAFVVGKYITNDIFVIYERGFGEAEGDEITPETFTVEYELNDKLFLRLQSGSSKTSGADVILKFEQNNKK